MPDGWGKLGLFGHFNPDCLIGAAFLSQRMTSVLLLQRTVGRCRDRLRTEIANL
jgi:hypothetical protein